MGLQDCDVWSVRITLNNEGTSALLSIVMVLE